MLVLKWKERAFIEKVNSRCFCWFPAAILVDQNSTPIWRLHTKLYKGAWNVSANNWETLGHKETWTNCLYISLLQHFIFLASSTGRFPIYNFGCVPTTISVPDFTHYLFSDWPKAYSEFSKSSAPRSVFEISRTQTSSVAPRGVYKT